jgi:hypothetical protein
MEPLGGLCAAKTPGVSTSPRFGETAQRQSASAVSPVMLPLCYAVLDRLYGRDPNCIAAAEVGVGFSVGEALAHLGLLCRG